MGELPHISSWPVQAPPGQREKRSGEIDRSQPLIADDFVTLSAATDAERSAISQHAEVGHHPAVGAARCAVTVEADAVVGRAPGGGGDLLRPRGRRPGRPGGSRRSRCQGPLPTCGNAAAGHDLRSNFIAVAANPNATMHYDIGSARTRCASSRRSSPTPRMPAAVPRHPACSSATPRPGTAR